MEKFNKLSKTEMREIRGGERPAGSCTVTCYNPDDYPTGEFYTDAANCDNQSGLLWACGFVEIGTSASAECSC